MRAFLRFIWFPATVIGLVLFWLWLDGRMGWEGVRLVWAGRGLVGAGLALVSWCAAKTKHLVIAGPYRYVRNPMMYGVGMILTGLAL